MNNEKIVRVEYLDPEKNQVWCTVGQLREGSQHLLLLSEEIGDINLYSYTIIPRDFVRRIIQLRFK